jgi:hypothetical protein
VAIPAAKEEEKGGVENKEVLGVTGVLLPNKFGVYKVYELAPEEESVIVFGEPLKACAHKLLLLKAIAKEGGLVTDTCAMAVMVQEVGAVTKTVYEPVLFKVGLVSVGFCCRELKLFNPNHWYELPGKELAKRAIVWVLHTVLPATDTVGVGLTTKVELVLAVQPTAEVIVVE